MRKDIASTNRQDSDEFFDEIQPHVFNLNLFEDRRKGLSHIEEETGDGKVLSHWASPIVGVRNYEKMDIGTMESTRTRLTFFECHRIRD